MAEQLKDLLKDVEKRMKAAITVLREELSRVKTGRATPALIENVIIDYYGSMVELKTIASINTPAVSYTHLYRCASLAHGGRESSPGYLF